ncbi:hypothetical protein AD998_08410 [bacterium 336/3]|nr:hypothetical protein AD998_08410 [bacterium 336/3]
MIDFLKKKISFATFILFTWGFLLGSATICYTIGSISLLVYHVPAKEFPAAFMLLGVIMLIFSFIFNYLQRYLSFLSLAFIILLFFIIGTSWVYYNLGTTLHYYAVFVGFAFFPIFSTVAQTLFWGVFNRLFNLNDSRRFTNRLGASLYFSGIIFSFITILFLKTSFFKPEYLILGSSILFLLSLFPIRAIRGLKFSQSLTLNAQIIHAENNFKKLINNPYFTSIALFIVVSTLITISIDYLFIGIAKDRYLKDIPEIVQFVSIAFIAIFSLSFLVKVFLYQIILYRLGPRFILFIMPILVGSFVLVLFLVAIFTGYSIKSERFFLFFVIAAITKILNDVLKDAIETPIYKAYLLPINIKLRFDTQIKLEGIMKGIAIIVAGGGIWLLEKVPFSSRIYEIILIMVTLLILVKVASVMYNRYKEVLKDTLNNNEEMLRVSKNASNISYAEKISQNITQHPLHEVIYYLNVLSIINPILYRKKIIELLTTENASIQKISLFDAKNLCVLESIPILNEVMDSKYFPVLENSSLIASTNSYLKGADFRLEKIKYIEQLTYSKLSFERAFGALLSAYAGDQIRSRLLNRLFRDPIYKVRYNAILASANSSSLDLHHNLIDKLADPFYSNAALSAIIATGEKIFNSLESAFYATEQKESIQLRIMEVYERIGSEKAFELLLKKLTYPNQNISSKALDSISRCGYKLPEDRMIFINKELEDVCEVVVWNMSAHIDLQNSKTSATLQNALKAEINDNIKKIFSFLSLMYDKNTIDLVQNNIYSEKDEDAEFASELLDVVLSDTLKPMLLPILNPSGFEDKVDTMKYIFPTQPMEKEEVLLNLVQRDAKYVNKWTKACALNELLGSKKDTEDYQDLLMAQALNPNRVISEVALIGLRDYYSDFLKKELSRFDKTAKYLYVKNGLEKIEVVERKFKDFVIPIIQFEIVKFLENNSIFKGMSGLTLCEIAQTIEIQLFQENDIIAEYDLIDQMDYFILYQGSMEKWEKETQMEIMKPFDFVSSLFKDYSNETKIRLVSKETTLIFKIKRELFNELLSFHEQIPITILKNHDKIERTINMYA